MPTTRKQGTKRKTREDSPADSKRNKSDEESEDSQESEVKVNVNKPICKYGEKCYQKNPYHLSRFRHPHREKPSKPDTESQEELNSTSGDKQSTVLIDSGQSKEKSYEEQSPPQSNLLFGEDDLPPSPEDVKENIKQKYLVEMPDDFYSFWEFQKTLNSEDAFIDCLGIKLVGPFELLEGKTQAPRTLQSYLLNSRFYYDPPEFQTVIVVDVHTGHHLGYFRDNPKDFPSFVGSNVESEGCAIVPYGDNLFSALRYLINEKLIKADPFLKTKLTKLKSQTESWASKNGFSLENHDINKRKKRVVAKTFYQSGIVVPVNKKSNVGYRPIPTSDRELKNLCEKIAKSDSESDRNKHSDELQTLITYVQYANDEMDYGMGLELGLDLLAFGSEIFHSSIEHLLSVAYELLERQEFSIILKAHLSKRQKLAQQDTH